MAVKTITIDLEAYDLLVRRKRVGQSFSRAIKEQLGTPRSTARDLLACATEIGLSEQALAATERIVGARARSRARAPKL